MNLGLYIHIPFCRRKCGYCSFYSVPLTDHREIDEYIKVLILELKERSAELSDFKIDTIYFGGGTPSLLNPFQVEIILSQIHRAFKVINEKIEITIECNPDDFSVRRITDFRSQGISRIVLGMQTMSKNLHSMLGRSSGICSHDLLSDFAGIENISHCVDLIMGIPGQSLDDLMYDVNTIVEYGFEHVSAYTLSIEEGTPISKKNLDVENINDMQRTFLEKVIDFFKNAGYNHYEVSNYAVPFHESKHNLKYWKFLPYAGFGPGAHSFYNGDRFYNINSVKDYIKENGIIRQRDTRTKNSEIVEYILSGMRVSDGISLADLERKLGAKLPYQVMNKIFDMGKKSLLDIEEKENDINIKFSREGFFQMDGLIYEITEMFL